jgi:hypothetical protein
MAWRKLPEEFRARRACVVELQEARRHHSDGRLGVCAVPSSGNLHALGPIGPVQIQATADADLGEGTRSITAMLDVTVIAGEASAGSIGFKDTGSGPPAAKRK